MKIEIDTNDAFFAGGNYDRVHLVNADKTFDDLDGKDSYWLVKVKKGTPTHDAISKSFSDRGDAASRQNAGDQAMAESERRKP